MAYPEATNLTDGLTGMMQYANQENVTGGWFGVLVLLLIYLGLMLYLINKGYEPVESSTSASFFMVFIAILMNLIDVISNKTMYISMVILAISVVWLYLAKSD